MSEASIRIAQRMIREAQREQQAGRFDDAIRLYQASINMFPTIEAHTSLSAVYGKQGRFDDAIQECMNAIQLDPSSGDPYNDIGAYLIEQDRLDDATEWLQQAIDAPRAKNPGAPYINLARIYQLRNDDIHAARMYRAAWEVDRENLGALNAYHLLLSKLN